MADEEKQKPKELTMADMEARPGAMTPFGDGGIAPRNFTELVTFARMIASSGMLPKSYEGRYEGAVVAMQMGAELGLTPMAAVRSICVINGQPSIWGDGLFALVKSDPRVIDVIEREQKEIMECGEAQCIVKVRNRKPTTCTLNMEWAQKAGLLNKKGPWQNYPARMLQMRARAFACRDAVPDRLSGIAVAEEAMDYDSVDMGPAEFIDPATAVPPEGTRKFGGKSAPETEKPPSPLAEKELSEALALIGVIAEKPSIKVEGRLQRVIDLDRRPVVVKKAREKLQAIAQAKTKASPQEPEPGPETPAPTSEVAAPQPTPNSADPVAPDSDPEALPEWEDDPEEEPPVPSAAEAEAAGQQKIGGRGF